MTSSVLFWGQAVGAWLLAKTTRFEIRGRRQGLCFQWSGWHLSCGLWARGKGIR